MSERPERQILESISDACFLLDPQWRCTYANGVASRMLGIATEQIEGRELWTAVPELQGSGLEERLRRCAETGEAARFETYFAAQDAFASAHCYPSEDGLTVFLTDLTEARRNARLLRKTEERFEAIADLVPVLLFSADSTGSIDYVNHRFASYAGLPAGELLTQGWKVLLDPLDAGRFERAWAEARARGAEFRRQCRLRSADGEQRWFIARARPMRDADGNVSRYVGCFTDIHQEKTLERDLAAASRHKDEFISMLAHELRNPLAPIRSAARVLGTLRSSDEREEEMVSIIQRQVGHMAKLLDDLLDVSRIERGKVRLDPERIDLTAESRRLVLDHQPLMSSRGLELAQQLPDEPLWIDADVARLRQTLGNVLQNAIKFTESGGRIEVHLERHGDEARLSVIDDGIGMDAETQARVFEPFLQADQSLDRSAGGLGLGMALVRGFMELHGGSVEVHSEGRGEGSRVSLHFGLSAEELRSPERQEEPRPPSAPSP